MRRRSKPRVVWLPGTNANSLGGFNSSTWQLTSTTVGVGTAGQTDTIEIPVTQDGAGSDPLDTNSTLADIESSGYRLRRIVGKIYCFIANTGAPTSALFGVTAGFMVRKVNANGPEDGTSMAFQAGSGNINPASISTSGDPWIWRRAWMLGNNGTSGTTFGDTPAQNFGAQYPGPLEGPHVDQKTARIVGPDDRLYLDFNVTRIFDNDVETSLVVVTDLRVLASMRPTIGNRRNATR